MEGIKAKVTVFRSSDIQLKDMGGGKIDIRVKGDPLFAQEVETLPTTTVLLDKENPWSIKAAHECVVPPEYKDAISHLMDCRKSMKRRAYRMRYMNHSSRLFILNLGMLRRVGFIRTMGGIPHILSVVYHCTRYGKQKCRRR